MEAKIMKMAKKFLAVALAGVLALSVLTGCGNSVKSKDVAKALTKMGIKVEQSKDVDKAAENTLTAIEAIINSETNTNADEEQKITLDNAVGTTGKLIAASGVMTGADTGSKVQTALGIQAGGANKNKLVRVALVKTENAKKDANLQAGIVVKGLVTAKVADTTKAVEPGKLGTAKTSDGKYMLVVIVNEISDN
jgi:ribosome maturation protein Sdo1